MSTTLEQVLDALGYDPELCSPDPVAWARGFRERFDLATEGREAAELLLTRIAREVRSAPVLIPEGPLDVRVKWLAAFAGAVRDARGNLQAREARALAILRDHGIEAPDVVSGLERLFDGDGFGEALAAAFRAGREMEARRRVGEAA